VGCQTLQAIAVFWLSPLDRSRDLPATYNLGSFGASDARLWREYNEAARVYIVFKGKVCYNAE
jgi:hypothetical protein